MHRVLGDQDLREKLVDDIAALVERYNFDGIDIDFEAKWAETNEYFSVFLRELYGALGRKWLYCTIESRTPLESRFDTIPANIEYANDYKEINKYCDRVQIMAYDQGTIDLSLSRAAAGPYVPVSDARWAEKVMREAAKTIDRGKLVLGIPTYGYEYEVEPLSLSTFLYKRLWSFNPRYALQIAEELGLAPTRNTAGEMQVLYVPYMLESNDAARSAASKNLGVPANPLSNVATAPAVRTTFNLMTWSDAGAVAQKIALAKKMQLGGVAIFKLDGGQDPLIWGILKGN
jgi:spore germination protein YaaH